MAAILLSGSRLVLCLDKLGIRAPWSGQQLRMRTPLQNRPVVHDGDAGRVADRGQTVRDDEACAAHLEVGGNRGAASEGGAG